MGRFHRDMGNLAPISRSTHISLRREIIVYFGKKKKSTQCLEHKNWHGTWRIQTSSNPQRFVISKKKKKTLSFASTWTDGKLRRHFSNYTINAPLIISRTRLRVNPARRMAAAVFTHDSLSLTWSKSFSTTVSVGLSWL